MGVQNSLTQLKLKTSVSLQNFYTPLNTQVEALETKEKLRNLQVATTQNPESRQGSRQVCFTPLNEHKDKNRTSWQQKPHSCTSLTHKKNTENTPQIRMTQQQVKQGVLKVSIPSAEWYTVCTSHTVIIGDPFIHIEQSSYNSLHWQMDTPPLQPTYPN